MHRRAGVPHTPGDSAGLTAQSIDRPRAGGCPHPPGRGRCGIRYHASREHEDRECPTSVATTTTAAPIATRPHAASITRTGNSAAATIIGWGKGGKTLAGQVGRAGRRAAVVEQSDLMVGGSCINIACVPTKALIHDAESRRGDDPQSWFDAAVARRDTLTRAMRARNHSLLAAVDSVVLVSGTARFTGPREVVVSGLDDRIRISADSLASTYLPRDGLVTNA